MGKLGWLCPKTLWYHHHHHHHHQSLNCEGRWGTTDDFATSFLHFPLFSTALWVLPNSRPVHSLMLSSHLFLCPPCLLPPFTVPCKMVLARPDERETWPYQCSSRLFTIVRRSSCGPIACWILARTSSLVTWSLNEMCCCSPRRRIQAMELRCYRKILHISNQPQPRRTELDSRPTRHSRAVDASLLGEVLGPVEVLEGLLAGHGRAVGQGRLHGALEGQAVHGARRQGAVEAVVARDGHGRPTAPNQRALRGRGELIRLAG